MVVDVFHVDILKYAMILRSTCSMDFEIKCVTVCACYCLLFAFFYLYIFMPCLISLIIWIGCDVCKSHCLETRDGFYPVYNSRDLLDTSVDFYPAAHSRNFGEHIKVVRIATSNSPIKNTNQFVTGNERSTVITLKGIIRAVKYMTTFALW